MLRYIDGRQLLHIFKYLLLLLFIIWKRKIKIKNMMTLSIITVNYKLKMDFQMTNLINYIYIQKQLFYLLSSSTCNHNLYHEKCQ